MFTNRKRMKRQNSVSQSGLYKKPETASSNDETFIAQIKQLPFYFEFDNARLEENLTNSIIFQLENYRGFYYFKQADQESQNLKFVAVWNNGKENKIREFNISFQTIANGAFFLMLEQLIPNIDLRSYEGQLPHPKRKCAIL